MCDKKKFSSYREAKETINYIKKMGGKSKIPKRAYKCKLCGEYHLTSRKNRNH